MTLRRTIIWSLLPAVVFIAFLRHQLKQSSSFNYAYKQIGSIRHMVLELTSESSKNTFPFEDLSSEDRRYLKYLRHGPKGAHFLVTTKPLPPSRWMDSNDPARDVIVVCDTPYVEKWWTRFVGGTPKHVAAFSNGGLGSISPAEYAALDPSSFRTLDSLE